jgi:hypothetical protein
MASPTGSRSTPGSLKLYDADMSIGEMARKAGQPTAHARDRHG